MFTLVASKCANRGQTTPRLATGFSDARDVASGATRTESTLRRISRANDARDGARARERHDGAGELARIWITSETLDHIRDVERGGARERVLWARASARGSSARGEA